jgi:diaminohydroxyphosphoribosylaminopyrimidine deaminase / 5-amino-6-(5-phosphoribosylamino)uracil reductase
MKAMTSSHAKRPSVTLKLATSLDGRIATVSGHSKWITGALSRMLVHQMRAEHDCVVTGIGTVLADDPELTARTDPRPKSQPLRAVLDSQARTPVTAKLLNTLDLGPVCLFHGPGFLKGRNVANFDQVPVQNSRDGAGLDLAEVLTILQNNYQVKSVMVEAGAQLAGAFLKAGFVDRIVWFRAPIIIGGDGVSVFAALGVEDLSQALALDYLDIRKSGDDVVETYALKKPR